MLIDVDAPFKDVYRKAYLRVGSEGRSLVDLVNSSKDRTTISYARYLMCVKVGYIISKDYEVDHINMDKTDDRVENLQILHKDAHREKTRGEMKTGRNTKVLTCEVCKRDFEREVRNIRYKRNLCSRSCNGKISKNLKKKALCKESVKYIRDNFIKGDCEFGISGLARKFNVNKSTVAKALYNKDYL